MNEEILVSIKCLAYNHEKYIRKMLDGCLSQKVNFRYEIIVHDDASTDSTTEIIKEYELKYPDVIVPIYEEENQYAKGTINDIIYKKGRGKYIAFCEGDDYWTDENKLQMQIDYLESHPDCSFCFHDAIIVWENGTKSSDFFPDKIFKSNIWQNKSASFNAGELIELGFIPTASIVGQSKYIINTIKFCDNEVCGDLPLRLSLSMNGYGYYINKKMSAYRSGNPNSASGMAQKNYESMYNTFIGHRAILMSFDKITNYKWHDEVQYDINRRLLRTLMIGQKYDLIKEYGLSTMFWKDTTRIWKFKFFVKKYFGNLYDMLKIIRNKLKGIS